MSGDDGFQKRIAQLGSWAAVSGKSRELFGINSDIDFH